MSYTEYRVIAEFVDIFIKNWSRDSNYRQKNELDIEFKCGMMVAYSMLYEKIKRMMEIVEKYPSYKELYMAETGYSSPDWVNSIIEK